MVFKKLKDLAKEVSSSLEEGVKQLSDEVGGKPSKQRVQQKDETDTLPVKVTIKVQSQRYKRLSMPKRVEVSSKKEYEQLKDKLLNEFRDKFGKYSVSSGKSVNVWTDKAFKELSKTLVFDDTNLVTALKKHGKW